MIKALLFLAIALTLGTPYDSTPKALVLGLVALLIIACPMRKQRPALVFGVFLGGLLLKAVLAPLPVAETINLFAPNAANLKQYQTHLPAQVLRSFTFAFEKANPAATACDRTATIPWEDTAPCFTALKVPSFPFAFAVTSMSQSRSARKEYLTADSRSPHFNEIIVGANTWNFSALNLNQSPHSFYTALEISPAMVGGTLCRRGSFYRERQALEETLAETQCKTITQEEAGERLWGLQVNATQVLVLEFSPAGWTRWRDLLWQLTALAVAALLLAFTLDMKHARRDYTVVGLASAALVAALPFATPSLDLFQGLSEAITHSDSRRYLSWGQDILFALGEGRWTDALRGGEAIYIFTPGMRYFRALEFAFFGHSGLGYMLLMLFMPLTAYALISRLCPSRAMPVFTVFCLLAATAYIRILHTAIDGYADPLGFLLLLIASLYLMHALPGAQAGARQATVDMQAVAGFGLLALAIWMRPNFVIAGVSVAAFWAYRAARDGRPAAFVEPAPLALVLLMTWHNAYFGQQFVPLTAGGTLTDTLKMLPSAYWHAAGELLQLAPGEYVDKVTIRLMGWWLPLKWLLTFIPLYIVLRMSHRPPPPRLWLLGLIALSLQLPHLFYIASGRHTMAADMFGLICIVVAGAGLIGRQRAPAKA